MAVSAKTALVLLRQLEGDLDDRIRSLECRNDQLLRAKQYIKLMEKISTQHQTAGAAPASGAGGRTEPTNDADTGNDSSIDEPISELDVLLQKAKSLKMINPEFSGEAKKQSAKTGRGHARQPTRGEGSSVMKANGRAVVGSTETGTIRGGKGASLLASVAFESDEGASNEALSQGAAPRDAPAAPQTLFALHKQVSYVVRFVNFAAGSGGATSAGSSTGVNDQVKVVLTRFGYGRELASTAMRLAVLHPAHSTMPTSALWRAYAAMSLRSEKGIGPISVPLEAVRAHISARNGGKRAPLLLRGGSTPLAAETLLPLVQQLCALEEQVFETQFRQFGATKKRQTLVERASGRASKSQGAAATAPRLGLEQLVRMWFRLHGYREVLQALSEKGLKAPAATSGGGSGAAVELHAELIAPLLLLPLHAPGAAGPGAMRNAIVERFHSDYYVRAMLVVNTLVTKCCMKPLVSQLKGLCIDSEQRQHSQGVDAQKRIWQPALKKLKLVRSCLLLESSIIPGSAGPVESKICNQKLYFSLPQGSSV